jgi:hypothetical protein
MRSGAACFEIPYGAIRLRLLTPYVEIAADRLDGLLDDAQSHVKLPAIQKAHRLQSPARQRLIRFNPTRFIRSKQFADFLHLRATNKSYSLALTILKARNMSEDRDYRVLTADEKAQWESVKRKEHKENIGALKVSKSLFREYPEAVRRHKQLFPNHYLDVVELNGENLPFAINELTTVLSSADVSERKLLNFINSNKYFFLIGSLLKKYYNFGHHEAHIFREFPLSTTYIADYLVLGRNSDGWHFVFIELESVVGRITNSNGDFGSVIRKGISQIEDWELWLERNFGALQEYFRKHKNSDVELPEEFIRFDKSRIHFVVVAGRRENFKDKTYRMQRKSNEKNHLIIHYDNLLDAGELLIGAATY